MKDGVFISYRRSDTQVAVEHLTPRLIEQFGVGQVYRDLDSNRPGFDFTTAIGEALEASTVVLVVMGPRWATATDKVGDRRLGDPEDFTRVEIEQALRHNKLVIPVLVDSAEMPKSDELPDSLHPLTKRHAIRLRSTDWNYDIERLIEHLDRSGVRPKLTEEYASKRVKDLHGAKTYEREYPSTPAHAHEVLTATLQALHYPIVADYPERFEVRFLWGNQKKPAGRALAGLYRRMTPHGVGVSVQRTRPGHVKIVVENPPAGPRGFSLAGWYNQMVAEVGVGSLTLERMIARDFFDQIQRVFDGRGVDKDPTAVLDNVKDRWTKWRSRRGPVRKPGSEADN